MGVHLNDAGQSLLLPIIAPNAELLFPTDCFLLVNRGYAIVNPRGNILPDWWSGTYLLMKNYKGETVMVWLLIEGKVKFPLNNHGKFNLVYEICMFSSCHTKQRKGSGHHVSATSTDAASSCQYASQSCWSTQCSHGNSSRAKPPMIDESLVCRKL